MFWDYLFYSIILCFGLFMIIKPDLLVKISWSKRHGLDEDGQTTYRYMFQLLGVILVILSIIIMIYVL